MTDGAETLFTVGHSNHECATFIDLLLRHQITAVADVRSQRYSQYTPQFNRETLESALAARRIRYVFLGNELGARRDERDCYVDGHAVLIRLTCVAEVDIAAERRAAIVELSKR